MAALASSGGVGWSCCKSYHSCRLLSCILDCSSAQSWLLLIVVYVVLVCRHADLGLLSHACLLCLILESSLSRNLLLQFNW